MSTVGDRPKSLALTGFLLGGAMLLPGCVATSGPSTIVDCRSPMTGMTYEVIGRRCVGNDTEISRRSKGAGTVTSVIPAATPTTTRQVVYCRIPSGATYRLESPRCPANGGTQPISQTEYEADQRRKADVAQAPPTAPMPTPEASTQTPPTSPLLQRPSPPTTVTPVASRPPSLRLPNMPSPVSGRAMDARGIYATVNKSVWLIAATDDPSSTRISQGSAVAISPKHMLTNCHVIKGKPVIIGKQEKRFVPLARIAGDDDSDRCIVAVTDDSVLRPVPGVRAVSDIEIGEKAFTLGNPQGLEATIAEGIVSGRRHSDSVAYVQTTAPISQGSSGGGLFDAHGNLIGITTAYLKSGQNLNLAIAASEYWR